VGHLSTRWRKVRIHMNNYGGYEVQVWRVWFPFWVQLGRVNFQTVERAREYALRHHDMPIRL